MNRTFNTIFAAAIMTVASAAGAATSARDLGHGEYGPAIQQSERFVSTLSADQVRAGAREAVRLGLTTSYEGMTPASANNARIASTLSRDEVRADAREAVRTGQIPGYEGETQIAAAGNDGAVRVAAAR